MAKMGFGIGLEGDGNDDMGGFDDAELEDELNALMAGKDIRKYTRGSAVFDEPSTSTPNLEAHVNAALSLGKSTAARAPPDRRTVPASRTSVPLRPVAPRSAAPRAAAASTEAGNDESDIDENDPELLAELHQYLPDENISPVHTVRQQQQQLENASFDVALSNDLQQRATAFEASIADADKSGDVAKMRRLQRLLDQVSVALRDVRAGKQINIEELPTPSRVVSKGGSATGSPQSTGERRSTPSQSSSLASPEHHRVPPAESVPTTVQRQQKQSTSSVHSDASRTADPAALTSRSYAAPTMPAASLSVFLDSDDDDHHSHATPAAPPSISTHTEQQQQLSRQVEQFKLLAVQAKRAGNLDDAKAYLQKYKQVKEQLDVVSGKQIERASYKVPTSVSSTQHAAVVSHSQKQQQQQQHTAETVEPSPPPLSAQRMQELTGAPPPPTSVSAALQQRLEKYKESVAKALAEDNTSKARRMERIVKQYEEAVRDHKRGRPVDFESLPSPPGFAPIPVPGGAVGMQHSASAAAVAAPPPQSRASHPSAQQHSATAAGTHVVQPRASTSAAAAASQRASNQVQLGALVEKQKQFKLAALKAKNDGDIPLAKEYLRKAKGLEQMIDASQSGLPVNLDTVPAAPTNHDQYGYEVVSTATLSELRPNVKFDRTAVFKQLEVDLINQVKMCRANTDTFSKAGDVDMAKRFQQFLKESIHDLETLRNAFQHGDPPPRFHYETRSFNLAKVHAELPENALELLIVRAVGLHAKDYEPSQMDSFVVYDFPYPSENHQTNRTPTFRSTNSPMYNSKFIIEINRRSRGIERIFKKQGIKCEIFLKGGFLRADRLLGRVFIDLSQLETKCEMHQAFDVVDEKRKPLSGKLEVKMRLREPLSGKHIEPVKETWLVIDEFVKVKQ